MRIVIAPDKFKGSLSAAGVARAIADGVRDAVPHAEVDPVAVADGGEGTLDAAIEAGFEARTVRAADPLGRPVDAAFAMRGREAVIEMAAASGLTLVAERERDALAASSRGTGDLIGAALDAGATNIVLAIGGSASTDGGAGMLSALGARLLDDHGAEVPDGGGHLARVAHVDLSSFDSRVAATRFVLASDVDHVLCGPAGAAHVFGPQKGASDAEAAALDRGLGVFARALASAIGTDAAARSADEPGSGAAGGVGFGARAALRAERRAGVDVVLEFTRLRERLEGASLAITGEGSFDEQSLGGKTPMGVARVAREAGIPTIVVCGRTTLAEAAWRDAGFAACYAVSDRAPDALTSMREAARFLRGIGRELGRELATLSPRRPGASAAPA